MIFQKMTFRQFSRDTITIIITPTIAAIRNLIILSRMVLLAMFMRIPAASETVLK